MTNFELRVKRVVSKIPKGKTMSYSQVALESGSPGAARAVGNIMKNNYDPTIPCHRVVKSDGSPGNYNRGGTEVKKNLLVQEGVL